MSQTYTPVATSHGSFTLPSDGDPAVAESVNDALRDLADNSLVALNTSASALAIALQAINGTTGGTYSPAADIIIDGPGGVQLTSGADLTISGASIFSVTGIISINNASVQVLGPISISGDTFTISADTLTTFNGNVVIDELTAGHFDAHGNIGLGNSASDTMVVEATSTFESPVTFNGPIVVDQMIVGHLDARGNITLGNNAADPIAIEGTMTLQTLMGFSGAGRVPYRFMTLPDASATITIEDGNLFRVPNAITGNWVYTLSTTDAEDGDFMLFFTGRNNTLSGQVTLNSPTFGEDTIFQSGVNTQFALFIYAGGSWYTCLTD